MRGGRRPSLRSRASGSRDEAWRARRPDDQRALSARVMAQIRTARRRVPMSDNVQLSDIVVFIKIPRVVLRASWLESRKLGSSRVDFRAPSLDRADLSSLDRPTDSFRREPARGRHARNERLVDQPSEHPSTTSFRQLGGGDPVRMGENFPR